MIIDASALLAIAFGEPEPGAFTDMILSQPTRLASTATPLEAGMGVLGLANRGVLAPGKRADVGPRRAPDRIRFSGTAPAAKGQLITPVHHYFAASMRNRRRVENCQRLR